MTNDDLQQLFQATTDCTVVEGGDLNTIAGVLFNFDNGLKVVVERTRDGLYLYVNDRPLHLPVALLDLFYKTKEAHNEFEDDTSALGCVNLIAYSQQTEDPILAIRLPASEDQPVHGYIDWPIELRKVEDLWSNLEFTCHVQK